MDRLTDTLDAATLEKTPLRVLQKLDAMGKRIEDLEKRCEKISNDSQIQEQHFQIVIRKAATMLEEGEPDKAELTLHRART